MGHIQTLDPVSVPAINGLTGHPDQGLGSRTQELTMQEAHSSTLNDATPTPEPALTVPQTKSVYDGPLLKLVDRHADEPRELRVAVVGAGLSGILAGILLPPKVPGIKLTIFEKNADVVCGEVIELKKARRTEMLNFFLFIGRYMV